MSGPALPDGRFATDRETVDAHRLDRSGWVPAGRPLGVALAASVADVRAVLRHASATGTPVVVRGAGTGLSGAAAATDGSIVLDVSRLNRITEISVADQLAVVEPGVITADLDRAAAAHGLRYAPDPASAAISTIGGNIATNAGGLRCAKYGVTRDSVLSLDVVLADGEVISTGHRTVKNVTGYDLTGLFTGSEGTLGVIVGATVRLRPLPAGTATVAAWFDDIAAAAAAVTAIAAAGVQPAVAELLDAPTLAAVERITPGGPAAGAFLLVQTDGPAAATEADQVLAVLGDRTARVFAARDDAEAEQLLAVRRQALPALERLGRVLIEDVAVPRSRLAEAVEEIQAISKRHAVPVFTMAHAADGNLHPILVVDRDRELDDEVWAAADAIFTMALDLGGTLTGEHGVGVLKRTWLGNDLGERNLALQRRLRAVFDPAGILNPGKAV
ncbi:FAD-binding protein [Streptomyces sp. NBC_01476]|uniref:FAD-binding oxidoreductase n=1 Tax=Streptomyces sp. NBC_01476 TaxID=2903881 RepID=UPI002E348284|nr:FAD-linked oxidase C-terminal domain-containing protein [Streptomyces sp. NBC_01476]